MSRLTAHISSALTGITDSLTLRLGLRSRIRLILICGPWGSGTTAVAGMMAALGAQGFGPYYITSDQRTKNSYEFLPFRELVMRHASERTVALMPDAAREVQVGLRLLHRRIERQEFGPYDVRGAAPVFFKYPLSALLIPQICETFDTRLVYVVRPLEDIERTRQRRRWGSQFGRGGAEILYKEMSRVAELYSPPVLEIDYPGLLASPAEGAARLAHFAGLKPSAHALQEAIRFVRPAESAESPSRAT